MPAPQPGHPRKRASVGCGTTDQLTANRPLNVVGQPTDSGDCRFAWDAPNPVTAGRAPAKDRQPRCAHPARLRSRARARDPCNRRAPQPLGRLWRRSARWSPARYVGCGRYAARTRTQRRVPPAPGWAAGRPAASSAAGRVDCLARCTWSRSRASSRTTTVRSGFVPLLGFELVEDLPALTSDGRPKRRVVELLTPGRYRGYRG